jgi:type IV pilus assembly protein PilW
VVTDDGTATGHKTGALMRCDSSTADGCQELVRGVERLDFLYGVEDSSGGTRYLGADDVDSAVGATIPCPPGAPNGLTPDGGCLWRAVKSVELHVLMDGQNPLYTMTAPDMAFTYLPDGVSTPGAPDNASLAIKPADQGFDPHMIRREFTALVMLRNYNP